MAKKLTCEQVLALMSFYVEDKLSSQLSKQVKEHLENCEDCRESFKNFQQMLGRYLNIEKVNETETEISRFDTKQYKNFRQNLSAYMDNELDLNENLKIKKIAISNPLARQDLENMYSFKKLLNDSFNKTKSEMKSDFSKSVVYKLKNKYNILKIDAFFKLSAAFLVMLFMIMAGSYYILHL
ncbi:MAG: zf-HC2 domain-containing protein [Clostridiaceae bacterium]|jgi:hypothetical protein|nr:zf-HC2 domain-containing protein [Clostridiaceae bacterium]